MFLDVLKAVKMTSCRLPIGVLAGPNALIIRYPKRAATNGAVPKNLGKITFRCY